MKAKTSSKRPSAPAPKSPLLSPALQARLDLGARVLLVLWTWVVALQVKYHPGSPGLDHSGAFTFNYAHARGMIFGRDLAFTYGPLAWLTVPMPAGNLELGILFQLFAWLVFAAVTGWMVFVRRLPLTGVLLFALGLYLGSGAFRDFGYAGPDMFLVYLGLLLLGASLGGRSWILWYVGAAAVCVLVFFVKFSSAATLGGAMALFTGGLFLSEPAKARRALLVLAAVPCAIFAAYVVFYGSPAWLWRYIRVALEMSAGYGVTMSMGSDTTGLITAIALMAAFLAAAIVLFWRRICSWPLVLACLLPLFLEFKHSFAREPGHIEIFFMFVPLLWGLAALFTPVRRQDLWYAAAVLLLPIAIWIPRESVHLRELAYPLRPLTNLHILRDALHMADLRRSLEQIFRQDMARDRLPAEMLARIGRAPVAIFPMECSYAGANPIEMRPFPIFQSYQAYTAYLDRWNASFLEDSRTAPPFILFDWDTLDDRHPLLDVPATTLSLYRHYDLDGTYGDHTLLRKRAAPRFGELRLLETRRLRLAEPVRFPAGDKVLTARIHLAWNARGKLLKFLFRLPEVRLMAATTAGRVLNVRVPPDVMEDGVPNFVPFDMAEARALFGGPPPVRLDAVLIGGPGAQYLEPEVRVEIYEAPDSTLRVAVPPAPDFNSMPRLGTLESARIEVLNDTGASAFENLTVPDTRGYVRIQGWAVVNGAQAGGVIVELDGKPHPAEYGRERPDVAAIFHSPSALHSAFEWSVPAWDLGKGWHELSLKILAPGVSGYYDGPRKLRFRME